MNISSRDQIIFSTIMNLYCDGENSPVASSHVAKRSNISLCSATVRNAMARLEKAGLLYSPHTSAGRIPTSKGFDFWFSEFFDLPQKGQFWQPSNQQLAAFAHTLSQQYQSCVIVGMPELTSQLIYRAEVIEFRVGQWLVLLIDKEGQSQNICITKPDEANDQLRNEFNIWLNTVFSGHPLFEGLRRMNAMSSSAPMFCHGSLTMWIQALAQKLNVENTIVIGNHHLFDAMSEQELNKLGAPILSYVEDKLAMKNGISVLYDEKLPFSGLEQHLVISIPYFNGDLYQSRLCVVCHKSAKIESIINEMSHNCSTRS